MATTTHYNRFRMAQRAIPEDLFNEALENPTLVRSARDGRFFNVLALNDSGNHALVLVRGGPRDPDPVVTAHWSIYDPTNPNGFTWVQKAAQHAVGLSVVNELRTLIYA